MGLTTSCFAALGRALLSLRYHVRAKGLEDVEARGRGGILFLPNHPALIDPIIVATLLHGRFRPVTLADQDRVKGPIVSWIARKFGVRPLPDPATYGEACRAEVERVIRACAEDLARGRNVLLWPGGRLMRGRREDLGGNSGVETILAACPGARVVLVRTRGLWGSSFSRISGHSPDFMNVALRHLRHVFRSFIFFIPRRSVVVELAEPPDFPRGGGRDAMNRAMEAYFNERAPAALHVPYTPWEPGGRRHLPDPPERKVQGDPSEVSPAVREQVTAKLLSMASRAELRDEDQLARDLGLDSLRRLELQLWIAQEFGHDPGDPEALHTVGDALLAASGRAPDAGAPALKPVPSGWFEPSARAAHVPAGGTLTEVFLAQAARGPGRAAIADQASGMRTYRDLVTAVLALRPRILAIEGDYVGILLPASTAAAVAHLAVLFSGKTPVMVNWTTGARNMLHGLDLLGVRKVLTSRKVTERIQSQGQDLGPLAERFLPLEDVGASLGAAGKLRAFLQARLSWRALRRAKVPDIAAVLFTSGSESLPKAVPLTHANLLANVRDIAREYRFLDGARFMGILPPFHSFGLTGTVVLPLCAGFQAVYYPVPTDGAAIARHIDAYRVTALVGTPTFLNGILRACRPGELDSLEHVISGAERCPDALFRLVQERRPGLLVLEGYGITECSPVVSANREDRHRAGTIGWPLPSVRHAVVDPATLQRVPGGERGLLLVRGPSVFGGYLGHGGPQPFVDFEGEAWYRTGDLVVEEEDGMIVFKGRLKRFVKLGGEMVSLPAVEEVLAQRFTTPDDDEAVLAVEAREAGESVELVLFAIRDIPREEANAAIREAGLSPIHNIRTVRRLDKIPVLGTGKTDYQALKAMLAD